MLVPADSIRAGIPCKLSRPVWQEVSVGQVFYWDFRAGDEGQLADLTRRQNRDFLKRQHPVRTLFAVMGRARSGPAGAAGVTGRALAAATPTSLGWAGTTLATRTAHASADARCGTAGNSSTGA